MSELCKICANELGDQSLEQHIIDHHANHSDSVQLAYPGLYEQLFNGDQLATGSSAGAEGSTAERSSGDTTDRSVESRSSQTIDRGTAKKWLFIGVGGAGNHILDSILMRRDTLTESNDPLAQVWKSGIADYLNLNTNRSEVFETYYARVDKEYTPESLVSNCMIGHQEHAYSGAGRDWSRAEKWAKSDFADESNAFVERWDIDPRRIGGAQAIMLLHSVTKGTGCGATPVLAEELRDLLTDGGPGQTLGGDKPILSSVVLPSENEFGESEMVRGVIGMARLARSVDGIIPFDNAALDRIRSDLAIDINQQWLQTYNPPQYEQINRLLVSFFEGFTMSSTPISYDATSTQRIHGDMFDVPDSIRPAKQKYPFDTDLDFEPAVVMVPVLGRHAEPQERSDLDTLLRSTLLQGRFIDFDPSTSWGGTFMIYGPERKMEQIEPLLNSNEMRTMLGGEDFLDRENVGPGESIDIYVDQLVVPHVDSVYLWGLIWNPRLPSVERMHNHAEDLVNNSESRQAKALEENWHLIEPLFGHLGRENMG